jgi:proteasome activator subunit 4
VQKLVSTNSADCLIHLNEEVVRTAAYTADVPGVDAALCDLKVELESGVLDDGLWRTAVQMAPKRVQRRLQEHDETASLLLPKLNGAH